MSLDPEIGLVSKECVALLRRTFDRADANPQDELRIYESKWHSTHFQCIRITNETTCRRIMFAPDDSKLPLGECVMKLESGCESVVFSLKGNLLKMLQHTCVRVGCVLVTRLFYLLHRSCVIQLDDSAFFDHEGFRTSVMAFADDDGSTFESYGGGWHLIVPSSKEEHLKLFEVRQRACECAFA
jgi:hypothetical protein